MMTLEEYELGVGRAERPADLWALATGFFQGTVVERATYHHFPPLGARDAEAVDIHAYGFPEAIIDEYVRDHHYRSNPLLQHALGRVEPFYFDTVALNEFSSAEEVEFFRILRELGFDKGLGVQVFGPNGRNGYCGLGFAPGVTRIDPVDIRRFQWVCQLGHLRYCAMILPTLGPAPQLSDRETEVLNWVARGKSNTSIGDILGISAHTVDAHLRRIYLKLGVVDRISAAIRGIGVGLIHSAT